MRWFYKYIKLKHSVQLLWGCKHTRLQVVERDRLQGSMSWATTQCEEHQHMGQPLAHPLSAAEAYACHGANPCSPRGRLGGGLFSIRPLSC